MTTVMSAALSATSFPCVTQYPQRRSSYSRVRSQGLCKGFSPLCPSAQGTPLGRLLSLPVASGSLSLDAVLASLLASLQLLIQKVLCFRVSLAGFPLPFVLWFIHHRIHLAPPLIMLLPSQPDWGPRLPGHEGRCTNLQMTVQMLWVPITWALFQADARLLMSMQLRECWSSCSSEFSSGTLTRSLATPASPSHPDIDADGHDEVNGILHQGRCPFSLHALFCC